MIRNVNITNILKSSEFIPTTWTNLQSIRWRRKPRWVPIAKSKMFRVPPRTIIPEDEKIELMRLYNNYRNHMKAIRSYLHSEYNVKSVVIDTEVQEKEFLEDFNKCCKINDKWNEEVRYVREARRITELEKSKELALHRMDLQAERKRKIFELTEEMVRKEKKASVNFITPEKLDAAVEHAIANPVDYNYSIDLEGNLYHGKTTRPKNK